MKYSTTKIPPANMNNSAGKASAKSSRLRKSQQKGKEICQVYFMQLRSGLIIEKKACYFRKETTERHSPNSAEDYKEPNLLFATCQNRLQHFERSAGASAFKKSMVQETTRTIDDSRILGVTGYRCGVEYRSVSLSTYDNQSITFVVGDEGYYINVDDLGTEGEKDKVLFHLYDSQLAASGTGDDVDGHKVMVRMSPANNKDFLLHAEEHSVKVQKYENSLPDQTLFLLHKELGPSKCVSFECNSKPGVYLGVEGNHLALIEPNDQTAHLRRKNIIFKLSEM
ncbi:interleukin-33 isoform X1 [Myotis lucifugus]|uniref:interleukin-33 isoform X1 n=1 Tax=Myotis lucifugus TaxID=59463 RepID=UPI0006D7073B|nr:interleukin-33 isoform X1 [Myotis lucifugus]